MNLEDLKVYQLAMEIGETCWSIVTVWDYFQKDTIGKQMVRSADSIAANISEGFGRFHFKENRQFCFYSRGSLFETKTWLVKAHDRGLIPNEEFTSLKKKDLNEIGRLLNGYIKSIGNHKNLVKEPAINYGDFKYPELFDLDVLPFPID